VDPEKAGASRKAASCYQVIGQLSFNIYDNENKFRLGTIYPSRFAAEVECERLNGDNPEGLLAE
jgi:hypothetical protein